MRLDDAYEVFNEIKTSISKLEDSYGYLPDEFDYDNKNEKYEHDMARLIVDRLDDVQKLLKWVESPIIAEGNLSKNDSNRYEVSGVELSSGYPLDYWDAKFEEWNKSSIEHNGTDYYIVGHGRDKNINNMYVRVRK